MDSGIKTADGEVVFYDASCDDVDPSEHDSETKSPSNA